MLKSVAIILLFGILSVNIHAQATLIGHWQFIPIKDAKYFHSSNPQSKDLILNSDSTFIIIGDTATIHDTIPGWHVGGQMEGKWKYIQPNKRKILRLYLKPLQDNFFIDYQITKLRTNALDLKLVGKITYTIKYRR